MEKFYKIVLLIIVGVLLINLAITLFFSGNIKALRDDVKEAKLLTDSALHQLNDARKQLDYIKSDMLLFSSYLSNVQKTVMLDDLEKMARTENDVRKRTELNDRIKRLKTQLDKERDSLPDIEVVRAGAN